MGKIDKKQTARCEQRDDLGRAAPAETSERCVGTPYYLKSHAFFLLGPKPLALNPKP